ncbi:MAG: hypothetical protein AAFP02_26095 [Bacteroidota bacterium]
MDQQKSNTKLSWQKRLLVASCLLIVLVTLINLLVSSQIWFSDSLSGIVEQVQDLHLEVGT